MTLFVTAVSGVLLAVDSQPLEALAPVYIAAIPAGFFIITTAVVSERWVADRTKDSYYGKLLRIRDRDESEMSMPYRIVTVAGIAVVIVAALGIATRGELSRSLDVAMLTLLILVLVYAFLGTVSLLRITWGHHRRYASLLAAEEEAARLARERRREQGL